MDIENTRYNLRNSIDREKSTNGVIKVKAHISCPECTYNKVFKNSFRRNEMEMLTVALKVFDWLVCNNCGELLNLNLEFEV